MRAVVTRAGGGLGLADVPRPVVPPGGGLVRVSLCGLCGSDLEKLTGPMTVPGVVLGHEVMGWLERPGREPVRVALAHHVPCGVCSLCRSGHSSLCARFTQTQLDPGGFAEELAVTAAHLADAVLPLPAEVDDLTATLLEPLSCVLRAVETAAGLLGAFPAPDVSVRSPSPAGGAGGLGDADDADDADVLVAGCGSVGLLFLSVLAGAGAIAVSGDPGGREAQTWVRLTPGRLHFIEPDPGRARTARELGALEWGRAAPPPSAVTVTPPLARAAAAPPPRLAFVTALGALPEVVELLAPGGVAVVFAGGGAPPAIDIDRVYRGELTIAGVRSGSPRHLRQALAALSSGRLPLSWYRPEVVDLEGLPVATERYAQGEVVKVVARV